MKSGPGVAHSDSQTGILENLWLKVQGPTTRDRVPGLFQESNQQITTWLAEGQNG